MAGYESDIIKHYKAESELFGASMQSTMRDEITRRRELDKIESTLRFAASKIGGSMDVCDVGCGNGCSVEYISSRFPEHRYTGVDISAELIDIAKRRNLTGCSWHNKSILERPFNPESFDFIYTERCLINILSRSDQLNAIKEIHGLLKTGGYYLMIEAFQEGLDNLNRARGEMGLDSIQAPDHNLNLTSEFLKNSVGGLFKSYAPARPYEEDPDLKGDCFLSSHYFIARVIHPCLTNGSDTRNTEFVKFFSCLPPIGDYSPIKAHLFMK